MLIIIAILLLALFVFLGLKKPGIALITSPFVSFLLFCISGEADSVAAMAIAHQRQADEQTAAQESCEE